MWRRPVSRLLPRVSTAVASAWVAGVRVGGRQGFDEQREGETRPLAAPRVQVDLVDVWHDVGCVHQVRLHEPAVNGVVRPGRLGEVLVGLRRAHGAAAHGHVEGVGPGLEGGGHHEGRVRGDVAGVAGEGGGDLGAGEPDQRVGAEDRRVVGVEQVCGCVHSHCRTVRVGRLGVGGPGIRISSADRSPSTTPGAVRTR
jgi:hypothetical protein